MTAPHDDKWTLCCPETLKVTDRSELKKGSVSVRFSISVDGSIGIQPHKWWTESKDWLAHDIHVLGLTVRCGKSWDPATARAIWRELRSQGYDIHPHDRYAV